MVKIERAERIQSLPPYLFAELDRKRDEVRGRGVDVIDLGVGDPDLPTPEHIRKAAHAAIDDPANHKYPSYAGMARFREAVATWYGRRFDVKLDPKREVLATIGAKEGIAHFPLAYLNPGDVALMTDPGYPVYYTSTIFCGAEPYLLPLTPDNNYLPDLDAVPEDIRRRAKLLWFNYPNNPTGATCDLAFFDKVVRFCDDNQIIACHDAAYTEMTFDDYRPPSFMQADGAREVGVEFHSLSKAYNMTGWRIGMTVGGAEFVKAMGAIKTNVDSGAFRGVQWAAVTALESDQGCIDEMRSVYGERRAAFCDALTEIGLENLRPKATFYVWITVPTGYDSAKFAAFLLEECGIVTTPGSGFGHKLPDGTIGGEGFVRAALTQPTVRLLEAVERIRKARTW